MKNYKLKTTSNRLVTYQDYYPSPSDTSSVLFLRAKWGENFPLDFYNEWSLMYVSLPPTFKKGQKIPVTKKTLALYRKGSSGLNFKEWVTGTGVWIRTIHFNTTILSGSITVKDVSSSRITLAVNLEAKSPSINDNVKKQLVFKETLQIPVVTNEDNCFK